MVTYLESSGLLKTQRIIRAMNQVDRACFTTNRPHSFEDSPQPIGWNATISAPSIHAICLEMLGPRLQPGCRVLDVGSGSGYLTAVLGLLVQPGGELVGTGPLPPGLCSPRYQASDCREGRWCRAH